MRKLPNTSTSNPRLPLLFAPVTVSGKLAEYAHDLDIGAPDARGNVPMHYADMHSELYNTHRNVSADLNAQVDQLAIIALSELIEDGIIETCAGSPDDLALPTRVIGHTGNGTGRPTGLHPKKQARADKAKADKAKADRARPDRAGTSAKKKHRNTDRRPELPDCDDYARDAWNTSRHLPDWFAKKTTPVFDEPGLGATTIPNLAHSGIRPERLINLIRARKSSTPATDLLTRDTLLPTRIATLLDVTENHAHTLVDQAVQTVIALPRLRTLAHWYALDSRRVAEAAQATRNLSIAQTLHIDEQLAILAPDCALTTFRRTLREAVRTAAARTEEEQALTERITKTRHIALFRHDDGSGTLSLTGPLTSLEPLYQRTLATARAIRRHNNAPFADQLCGQTPLNPATASHQQSDTAGMSPYVGIIDERTTAQLAFDLLAHTRPETHVLVQETELSHTGTPSSALGSPLVTTNAPRSGTNAPDSGAEADDSGDGPEPRRHLVRLACPTDRDWLRRQAAVILTIPALTYTGHADLPGNLAGHIPIPAGLARTIAADTDTVWRILTDPATGEVLPSQAQRYHIPQATRIALNARWARCTVPGCTTAAEHCEPEHLTPFNHRAPGRGGQSDFTGLHVMCKHHHDLKTRGILVPAKDADGNIVWNLGVTIRQHPLTAVTRPQTSPIAIAQARILADIRQDLRRNKKRERNRTQDSATRPNRSQHSNPPPGSNQTHQIPPDDPPPF